MFQARDSINRPEMVKRFLESKRTRFYLAVLREGEVAAGDSIKFTERQEEGVTVSDIVNLYTLDSEPRSSAPCHRAIRSPAWLERLLSKRLWDADA